MKLLLVLMVWSTCSIAMNSDPSERVIGHELSEKDKGSMRIVDHNKFEIGETVAIQQQGAWRYARVQSVPEVNCPGYGLINLRPAEPEKNSDYNNYGGQAFHFKHVRKLPSVEHIKVQRTE